MENNKNSNRPTIFVIGLGPGNEAEMTPRAREAIEGCDVIVGYSVYVDLVRAAMPHKETAPFPMMHEVERCRSALETAMQGKTVGIVSSGDPGVYGMAGLMLEVAHDSGCDVDVEVVPGITACCAGAAILGAPLTHDFAVISLSDLLTPWEKIEKRLELASEADFVICLYNPSSKKRGDYLRRACEIMLRHKQPDTKAAWVRMAGRDGESFKILTLAELAYENVDMFCTVFIGNSMTRQLGDRMVTPRGYDTSRDREKRQ